MFGSQLCNSINALLVNFKRGRAVLRLFSEREGIKEPKKLQLGSIDEGLRNRLWNSLDVFYWSLVEAGAARGHRLLSDHAEVQQLCMRIWDQFLKRSLDQLNGMWRNAKKQLRGAFFRLEWNGVLDCLEFVATTYAGEALNKRFMKDCNDVFEQEVAAYRFVAGQISAITSESEIQEIEAAIGADASSRGAREHIKQALSLLSDKERPDYRNSIKESISAVESLCGAIANDPKPTLGKCIKALKTEIPIHPALESAFSKLYGWTSEEDGIRHALMQEGDLSFEDAKFMLVACSAFVNYLLAKCSKTDIDISH